MPGHRDQPSVCTVTDAGASPPPQARAATPATQPSAPTLSTPAERASTPPRSSTRHDVHAPPSPAEGARRRRTNGNQRRSHDAFQNQLFHGYLTFPSLFAASTVTRGARASARRGPIANQLFGPFFRARTNSSSRSISPLLNTRASTIPLTSSSTDPLQNRSIICLTACAARLRESLARPAAR